MANCIKSKTITLRPGGKLVATLSCGTIEHIKMVAILDSTPEHNTVLICVNADSPPLMITVENGKEPSVQELKPVPVLTRPARLT